MKILCYAPYSGAWTLHGLWEFTILYGLKLRGCGVKIIICDGVYTDCAIYQDVINPRPLNACKQCINLTKNLLKDMHLEEKYDILSKYLSKSDIISTIEWIKGLNPTEIENACFENFNIGKYVKSSVYSDFRIDRINFSDRKIIKKYFSYLYSGALAYISLKKILETYKPDRVLLFNGRFFDLRILLELCKLYNISVYIHDRGYIDNSLTINKNTHCIDFTSIKLSWKKWENIPLNLDELEKTRQLLIERSKGKNLSWKVFSSYNYKNNKISEIISLYPNRKIAGLFTSSMDEMASEISEVGGNIFDSQLEWLEESIKFFSRQRDWILIIRGHPNICSENSSGIAINDYQDLLFIKNKLPENVFLIMPEERVNSYELIDKIDIGITYGSTIGLEIASCGKPVVISSKGFYHGIIPFISVYDKNTYFDILNKTIELDYKDQEIKKYIYRYIFYYFFRISIPFPLVSVVNVHFGRLNYTDLEDLKYGKDIYLDKITDSILSNKSLFPVPDEKDYSRDEKDEKSFFSSLKFSYLQEELTQKQRIIKSYKTKKIRILAIETGFNPDYVAIDNLWKMLLEYNFEVMVIAPQIMDSTKGSIECLVEENRDGVEIRRIYKTFSDMVNNPYSKKDEIIDITREFQPDIIYCHHINNHNVAMIAKSVFNSPLVILLEFPSELYSYSYNDIDNKLRGNTRIVIDWSKIKSVELEKTKIGEQYHIVIPGIVPVPKEVKIYKPSEKINRGIYCGSLIWHYKKPDEFIKLLPLLFEETPMEEFLLIVSPYSSVENILNKYGKKYNIKYKSTLPRNELLKEISLSYLGFSCMPLDIDGFTSECKALKTALFLPFCYGVEDESYIVKSIENVKRLYEDKDFYEEITEKAYKNYLETTAPENVLPKYVKLFNALLDGNLHETWEELRYKGEMKDYSSEVKSLFFFFNSNKSSDKNVLLSNPPWFLDNSYVGIRAGSRGAYIVPQSCAGYFPYPFLLGYTTSFLKANGIGVNMIDSILTRETLNSYIWRIKRCQCIENDLLIIETVSHYSKVALCGPYATVFAEELIKLPFVHAVLKGEYEKNALKLVETGKEGIYDYDLVEDLDSLPFPYRDYSIYKYLSPFQNNHPGHQLQIWSSRGCFYRCISCMYHHTMNLNKYRQRKVSEILREIKEIFEKFPRLTSVYFDDDTFNIEKERILEICNGLKKMNIPWTVRCKTDISDIDIFRVMKDSGCYAVIFEVKSGTHGLYNDNCDKKIDLNILEETVKELKKIGIEVHITLTWSSQEETTETIEKTKEFLNKVKPDSIQENYCAPFPETLYYNFKDLVTKGYKSNKNTLFYN